MSTPLLQAFYARDSLEVAPLLLGKLLVHGDVVLRISEVEAYCFPHDTANHCRVGRTARNAAMWGPAGHAYVYLCYGMHHLLNVVTNCDGEGAAVLIRSCEPVEGHRIIARRRNGIEGPNSLTGPGKVAAALGLTTAHSGRSLLDADGMHLLDAIETRTIIAGPRVGIAYATPEHQQVPWRFALADSEWVSHRKLLAETPGALTPGRKRSKRS
jgi:DNA-3-methyladenine glycosylase